MKPIAGRRAVVIGAAGFIGRRLARHLASASAETIAFVRPEHDVASLAASGIEIVRGDAASVSDLARMLRPNDVVFALAGASGAAASFADPAANLTANCFPLLALLETAATLEPRPRIVFTGSRLQYGRVGDVRVAEDHELRPTSPYGIHKVFCEGYLELYRERFGIPYAVARLTNPYGGDGRPSRPYNVLDQIIARAVRQEKVTIFGDGSQLRDYIHIDDVVKALVLLSEREESLIVNIGSGTAISFRNAVERIVLRTGSMLDYAEWPPEMLAVETGSFIANIDRARAIGFTPTIEFDDGIMRSIEAFSRSVQT